MYADYTGCKIKDLSGLACFKGICIFLLKDDKDTNGIRIWEDAFINDFINKFPQYENAEIKSCNNFYGEIVFRIKEED